jgi:hypothetical protein
MQRMRAPLPGRPEGVEAGTRLRQRRGVGAPISPPQVVEEFCSRAFNALMLSRADDRRGSAAT